MEASGAHPASPTIQPIVMSLPPHNLVSTHTAVLTNDSKSQLALQYAHSIRDASPQTFVFWVHASTRARFEEAYRDLAERLQLPGRSDPKANVLCCGWSASGFRTRRTDGG
jgi:hypothetical protein